MLRTWTKKKIKIKIDRKQHSNSDRHLFLKTEIYAVQPKIYQPGLRKSKPSTINHLFQGNNTKQTPLSKPDTASEADLKYTPMCSE